MPRPTLPSRLSSLPGRLKGGAESPSSLSRSSSPKPYNNTMADKTTTLILRVRVIKGRDLAAKDRSGTSDPYLVLVLGDAKEATSTINKTLNPVWDQSIDMPIVGEQSLVLDVCCWDKDRFGKDYMGEFEISVEDIFANQSTTQEPKWYPLQSKRTGKKSGSVTGAIQLQFTLLDPTNSSSAPQQILQKLAVICGGNGSPDVDEAEDERLERLESGDQDDDEDDQEDNTDETDENKTFDGSVKKKNRLRLARLKKKAKKHGYEFSGATDVAGVLFVEIQRITDLPPEKNALRTGFDMDPFVVTSLGKKTFRTRVVRHNLNPVYDEKLVFQVMKHEINYSLNFSVVDRDKLSGNDYVGSANFALENAVNTAPEADPENGLYNLPEIQEPGVGSNPEAKRSRFRLPMSRSTSSQSLSKYGKPSLSREASSVSVSPNLQQDDLAAPNHGPAPTSNTSTSAPTSNPSMPHDMAPITVNEDLDPSLRSYIIPLELKNKDRWEGKHKPTLFIRAKYLDYKALRQQFWRAMLKQYDADESGRIDKIELVTMLDTLGSTLHETTIDGFFKRFGHEHTGEMPFLTFDQAVICLEDQLQQTAKKSHWRPSGLGLNGTTTGNNTGYASSITQDHDGASGTSTSGLESGAQTPANSHSLLSTGVIQPSDLGKEGDEHAEHNDLADDRDEEHVIEIRECPICHQPRLNKKTDADIITHVATCASQDWRQVNNIVMAGFVTSSQAQRKWYSKVITKIGYGGYKLGANSANILVQDRITGQINEERMSVYVRLGIRLLYKGMKSSRMETKRIKKLLKSLSVKQGLKYDDPASAAEIASFVQFHQLDMSEVLLPMDSFRNFNEFFYRALKPGARPCSAPDRPEVVTSPADCRSVVFNTLESAQSIWVKGREFTVERLLGDAYPEDAKRYQGGALGIFRLAPQDYHRFHIPVDGIMGEPKLIQGEYYTVNPMAIRSALDVYGENIRYVVPIDSTAHGRVMVICVGAMMVGSTVITRKTGEKVSRAEELGYFKFGGSTILVLFEPGKLVWDDDLVDNSNSALETLIRVGMSVGHHPEHEAYTSDMKKDNPNPTQEEMKDAERRIGGGKGDGSGVQSSIAQ
ncbi:phosphatidylserine decarboxylase proenzyme [Venturia nashicola]|uniref:Phosphatidylserine decarboxylase proenzyme 2 n=1 Tax=Venturia nashicola TaxID=86259 RepID=A0A4Z1P9T3_9PEZI|nr:phosphatidylserine decarboxylase proenzyme [Venturia nashicola]TLD29691.1 phosphatidylserine decarboxylase proenzyme [Venturia nashicola]